MAAEPEGEELNDFQEDRYIYHRTTFHSEKFVKSLDEDDFKEYPFMQYPINKNFVKVNIGKIEQYVMDDIVNETSHADDLSEDELEQYNAFFDFITGNNLYIRPNKHEKKILHIYFDHLSQSFNEVYSIDLKNTYDTVYNVMEIPLMQNYLMKRNGENVDTMDIYTLADGVEKMVFDECMKRLMVPLNPNNFNLPSNLSNIISSYTTHNKPYLKYVDGKIKIKLDSDMNLNNTGDLKNFVHGYVAIAHEILSNGSPASMNLSRNGNSSRRSRSRNSSRSARSARSKNSLPPKTVKRTTFSNRSKKLDFPFRTANTNPNWRALLKNTSHNQKTANTNPNWRRRNPNTEFSRGRYKKSHKKSHNRWYKK